MKILIYTHCFYPEHLSALSKRMDDLARELVRAGYQVTIVTAFPNHPYGTVYPGYGGSLIVRKSGRRESEFCVAGRTSGRSSGASHAS